jgi:hypothetical protein
MKRTDTVGELAAALAKANLEIRNAELDRVNPHFKNRYATLGSILNAVRVPLAKHGIATVQTVSMQEGMVTVTTSLIHSSGQCIEDTAMFPLPDKATVQQMGSAITYLRRYALAAICGIVGDEDDDGENDRTQRTEPRRETFKPQEARGSAPVAERPAPKQVAPAPRQESVAAAEGEWIEVVPKFIDEGVAGKNQSPYVKIKDSNGDSFFVWDTALFGVVKASKGAPLWVITEASKKEGAPPRIVQVRTSPPAEPGSIPSLDDDGIPF